MQINLSNHTKIKIEAINDQLSLTLYDLMTGTIPQNKFKKLIKNKLKISEKNVHISRIDNDLVISIENESNLPKEKVIIEKILDLISYLIPSTLKNKYTGRDLIYITKNSGIPLIGSIYFGIIDRGTNLIQVRPLTGCILNCPFCSVDEGAHSKTRFTDYLINASYLAEEAKKLIEFKEIYDIEIHIDGQSEPTLYPHLPALIERFAKDSRVAVISMQTNGTPLNYKYIQKLEKAGLNRINLSINSLNQKNAQYLAGIPMYNIEHIKQVVKYIINSSIQLLVAPLWIPGLNDVDIENIISFVCNLNLKTDFPVLGIQNYLKYKFGRKVLHRRMLSIQKFNEKLKEWEEKFGIHPLILSKKDFGIHFAKSYPKIFQKGEKINAEIIIPGRMLSKNEKKREMLGKAKNRIIQIMNSNSKVGDVIPIKITNNKDNIYYGREL